MQMKLTDYDLKQINDETLDALSEEQVRALSKRLLSDLKAAKERLNQNPGNSSRPSGSMLPWENSHQSTAADSTDEEAPDEDDALLPTNPADEEEALNRVGSRPMDFTGKPMKGYVYVNADGMRTNADFEFWIGSSERWAKLRLTVWSNGRRSRALAGQRSSP